MSNSYTIFKKSDLHIEYLKKFNGDVNYFNCTGLNNNILYRKEYFVDGFLVSNIVNETDDIILSHKIDNDNNMWYSYEDPRWINDHEFSVVEVSYFINPPTLNKISMKKYSSISNELYHFTTQNVSVEKNWQIADDYIIYKCDPYTVLSSSEVELINLDVNWNLWSARFGIPRLSTNIFSVDNDYYMFFHSNISSSKHIFEYTIGLMKLTKHLIPIGYYYNPIISSSLYDLPYDEIESIYNWKLKYVECPTKAAVLFFMTVDQDLNNLYIYGGQNDCNAIKITIEKEYFISKLKNEPIILL